MSDEKSNAIRLIEAAIVTRHAQIKHWLDDIDRLDQDRAQNVKRIDFAEQEIADFEASITVLKAAA